MANLVYVGTSLHNADRAKEIMSRFREAGAIITYDWTTHGQVYTEEELIKIGRNEEQGVKDCDLFFMLFPGRNGTHFECGLAYGLGKHVVLFTDGAEFEEKTFYHLPNINLFENEDEAISHSLEFLKSRNKV